MVSCAKWELKLGCDFYGNDFTKKSMSNSTLCGDACISLKGCTHFTFTPDGTCWMKTGIVNINQAIKSRNKKTACGIVLMQEKIDTVNESEAFRKYFLIFIQKIRAKFEFEHKKIFPNDIQTFQSNINLKKMQLTLMGYFYEKTRCDILSSKRELLNLFHKE